MIEDNEEKIMKEVISIMEKYHKEQMRDNAKRLINDFINEELPNKDINELIKFSFWNIKNQDKYGNGKPYPDGDCTKIVYAIDYLLYCDIGITENFRIPGYPWKSEQYCNFKGETINTFNTLFAKKLDKQNKIRSLFSFDEWKKIKDDSQIDNPFAEDFFHVYQRLGNFMLLPSKTISFRKSINSYKGKNEIIHDYSDIFFNQLKQCLEDKTSEKLNTLNNLIQANNFYFTKDKTRADFFEDFYLQDYSTYELEGEHYYHWYPNLFNNSEIQQSYANFSLEYITNAKKLIEARSVLLVNHLQKLLYEKRSF